MLFRSHTGQNYLKSLFALAFQAFLIMVCVGIYSVLVPVSYTHLDVYKRQALEIFRQLGLVEQLDSGAFYMTDIELMIGQSSTEAERKRAARLENKALLPPWTKGGHLSDIRPPEIEIELEKEIEIEKEREGETGHPTPAAYGRYNNVIPVSYTHL